MYNPQQPEEVPNAIPESPKPQEHPRILMVAGQEYEVRVVNGKRLIVPTSSPVTRKPIRRTPGEDQVKREQMGAKQSEIDGLLTQKIVVDKKPQQRRERERGDKEYPAKRLRVNQIRSRSMYGLTVAPYIDKAVRTVSILLLPSQTFLSQVLFPFSTSYVVFVSNNRITNQEVPHHRLLQGVLPPLQEALLRHQEILPPSFPFPESLKPLQEQA